MLIDHARVAFSECSSLSLIIIMDTTTTEVSITDIVSVKIKVMYIQLFLLCLLFLIKCYFIWSSFFVNNIKIGFVNLFLSLKRLFFIVKNLKKEMKETFLIWFLWYFKTINQPSDNKAWDLNTCERWCASQSNYVVEMDRC